MNKILKVSIICPVYNKEPYIRECVESVLLQTYKEWELVLVDDESPDNCPQICDLYAELDDRIKVIHQKNAGHSEARNSGIRMASGDYLMFLDADDLLYDTDVLSNMIEHANKYDLDICLSKIATLKDGVLKDSTYGYMDLPYGEMSGVEVLCSMIEQSHYHATMCSRLFRMNLVLNNELFFEKLICDDEEWTPQVFYHASKVGFLDKNGYVIRKLDDSVTGKQDINTKIRKIEDKSYASLILMRKFAEFNDITSEQKQVLYSKFYSFFHMALYSFAHDVKGDYKEELKKYLGKICKELKKYKQEWNIKCRLQHFLAKIRLFN